MRQQQVRKQLQQEQVQQQVLQPQERVQELVLPFCRKQPKQQQPSEPRVQAICSLENSLRGRGRNNFRKSSASELYRCDREKALELFQLSLRL